MIVLVLVLMTELILLPLPLLLLALMLMLVSGCEHSCYLIDPNDGLSSASCNAWPVSFPLAHRVLSPRAEPHERPAAWQSVGPPL